jgi:bacterioferritin-associated ferredoxin
VYMCLCKGLTKSDVQRMTAAVPLDAPALIDALGLDDEVCCGRCVLDIDEFAAVAAPAPCAAPAVRLPLVPAPAARA